MSWDLRCHAGPCKARRENASVPIAAVTNQSRPQPPLVCTTHDSLFQRDGVRQIPSVSCELAEFPWPSLLLASSLASIQASRGEGSIQFQPLPIQSGPSCKPGIKMKAILSNEVI